MFSDSIYIKQNPLFLIGLAKATNMYFHRSLTIRIVIITRGDNFWYIPSTRHGQDTRLTGFDWTETDLDHKWVNPYNTFIKWFELRLRAVNLWNSFNKLVVSTFNGVSIYNPFKEVNDVYFCLSVFNKNISIRVSECLALFK